MCGLGVLSLLQLQCTCSMDAVGDALLYTGAALLACVAVPFAVWLWAQVQGARLQALSKSALVEAGSPDGTLVPGAPTPLPAFRTPGGTPFLAFSQYEANVLLHEMYHGSTESRVHATGLHRCGTKSPLVVDVGANVGTFTLWIKEQFPRARVLCVEALPPTAAVLRSNLAAAGHSDVVVVQSGAGSSSSPDAVFTFSPGMSVGGASLSGQTSMDAAAAHSAATPGLLATLLDVAVDVRRTFAEVATAPAPTRAQAKPAELYTVLQEDGSVAPGAAAGRLGGTLQELGRWGMLAGQLLPLLLIKQQHRVPIATLSSILQEHGHAVGCGDGDVIDFLKIDVEGAELEVLAGIAERDWLRTRGVMVEVHDADGALDTVVDTLHSRGFHVKTAQEVWRVHTRLGIYLVYGTRPEGWQPPRPHTQ